MRNTHKEDSIALLCASRPRHLPVKLGQFLAMLAPARVMEGLEWMLGMGPRIEGYLVSMPVKA